MDGHRHGARVSGLAAAVASLTIGTTGYLAARTFVAAKLAHTHAATPDAAAQAAHIHDPAAVFAVLAAFLTLISALTAAVVIGSLAGPNGPSRKAIRCASGLSIWTFILGNLLSYAAASTSATHPLLLLVVGGAAQLLTGGVAGLLLWQWIEVRLGPGRPPSDRIRRAQPYAVAAGQPTTGIRRRWWAAPAVGRAPPVRFA